MEAAPTSSLDDTTKEYYVKQEPSDSVTPLVDEEVAATTTPTTITSLNDNDTTQEHVQEETLIESQSPLVDGGEVGVVFKLKEEDEDVHATMTSTLPKYVIIQTNHNHTYLRYNGENPTLPNALHFDGDYSFSLETRFEVVRATTGAGLVHIRSLYNNKYMAHFGTGNQWVTAMAVKPEEDQSNRQCTLFRPYFENSSNNRVCRLRHVNTGQFVRRFNGVNHAQGLLTLLPKQYPNDKSDEFTFIDRQSVAPLPDLIRIKGDNGNYLRAWADGFMDYQVKADNSSLFDYEVSPSRNRGIRLKSVRFGTYWTDMNDSTWVLLRQASTIVHDINTVFFPVIRSGRIIMRSLKNNMFCNRHTEGRKRDCLATRATFPDDWSYMEIEEPVFSRTINNVRYHLTDTIIYNEGTPWIASGNTNNGSEVPQSAQLDIRRTVTNTTKWSNNLAWSVGFKMTFQRGVLDVSSYGIEISAEVTKETNWEETETESLELGSVRTVTTPPMARVEAKLIGTRISYDIPFSYTQIVMVLFTLCDNF